MKITATVSMWAGAVLALFAFGYAFTGLTAIDASATQADREAVHGYALFWLFLGVVFLAIAVASWLMSSGRLGRLDGEE